MKKLEEIIENYNISSRQMIRDEDFVTGLLSFHRGRGYYIIEFCRDN